MSGFDHFGYTVADHDVSAAFYSKALAPLGLTALVNFPIPEGNITGFGADSPIFWINTGGQITGGRVHVAFKASSRAAVDAFYAAALANGGTDNGPPGIREDYSPGYYAAFVFDPDGHNVEAVFHE